jgi:hypothetical protein
MDREIIARILNLPHPPARRTTLYNLDEIDFTPYLIEMETMWEFGEFDQLNC